MYKCSVCKMSNTYMSFFVFWSELLLLSLTGCSYFTSITREDAFMERKLRWRWQINTWTVWAISSLTLLQFMPGDFRICKIARLVYCVHFRLLFSSNLPRLESTRRRAFHHPFFFSFSFIISPEIFFGCQPCLLVMRVACWCFQLSLFQLVSREPSIIFFCSSFHLS